MFLNSPVDFSRNVWIGCVDVLVSCGQLLPRLSIKTLPNIHRHDIIIIIPPTPPTKQRLESGDCIWCSWDDWCQGCDLIITLAWWRGEPVLLTHSILMSNSLAISLSYSWSWEGEYSSRKNWTFSGRFSTTGSVMASPIIMNNHVVMP